MMLARGLSWRMPCVWIASVVGIGFLPASGTAASLVALTIAYLLLMVLAAPYGFTLLVALTGIAFFIGLSASAQWLAVSDSEDDDPSAIVIDEVAGQWFTIILIGLFVPLNHYTLMAAFLLFRVFDIFKPFPVNWLERTGGARGIMLDDMGAAIFAAAIFISGVLLWGV